MGDHLKHRAILIFWTAFLIFAIGSLDRFLIREHSADVWQLIEKTNISEAIARLHFRFTYLPNVVGWPPDKLFIKRHAESFFWLKLSAIANNDEVVWIGNDISSYPKEMKGIVDCLEEKDKQNKQNKHENGQICPGKIKKITHKDAGGGSNYAGPSIIAITNFSNEVSSKILHGIIRK